MTDLKTRYAELKKHYDSLESKTDKILTIATHTRFTSILVLIAVFGAMAFGIWIG